MKAAVLELGSRRGQQSDRKDENKDIEKDVPGQSNQDDRNNKQY